MDIDEDDQLGSVTSLGLHRVLASAGVDPNSFASFFDKTTSGSGDGAGPSSASASRHFGEIEAEDDQEKYEDDISEDELPAESAEDARAREREQAVRKAEEDRWFRRAMEMQRAGPGLQSGVKIGDDEKRRRKKEKERQAQRERVKSIWPEFRTGQRLRMTEVLYETPADKRAHEEVMARKKRRKVETRDTCECGLSGSLFVWNV
jgi:transcription initiation factor TFIID subunit 1